MVYYYTLFHVKIHLNLIILMTALKIHNLKMMSLYHLTRLSDSAAAGSNTQLSVPHNRYLVMTVKVRVIPSRPVARLRFTAVVHVRGSGHSGHTLT